MYRVKVTIIRAVHSCGFFFLRAREVADKVTSQYRIKRDAVRRVVTLAAAAINTGVQEGKSIRGSHCFRVARKMEQLSGCFK